MYAADIPDAKPILRSASLPAAAANEAVRIMAALSHAASVSHSREPSSSDEEPPSPLKDKSFTSQRSSQPFTAKRDKSFLDVQRFLGDSLHTSANKGKSLAKHLQVSATVAVLLSCLGKLLAYFCPQEQVLCQAAVGQSNHCKTVVLKEAKAQLGRT